MVWLDVEQIGLHVFRFEDEEGARNLAFRLFYQGPLKAATPSDSRARHKHEIRKVFHLQLEELWKTEAQLRWLAESTSSRTDPANTRPWLERTADNFRRGNYRYIPLIRKHHQCALNILFLRRDMPGNLIKSGGDIDNRLKVLFDALRMPDSVSETGGYNPGENENPFYCLLENDSSITSVRVDTDRFLPPPASEERLGDVVLVIQVECVLNDIFQQLVRDRVDADMDFF